MTLTTTPQMTVHQGPSWLAHLLYAAPPWANATIKALAAITVAITTYKLWRNDWVVPLDVQLEMGRIAGTIVAVMTGTLAIANLTTNPYLVDVFGGFIVGYLALVAATSGVARQRVRSHLPNGPTRAAAGWTLFVAITLLGPALVSIRGRGMDLINARILLMIVGVGMFALNIRQSAATQTDATGSCE